MELANVKTCDLVQELAKREGVSAQTAEPYEEMVVQVNGPAAVLVVTD